MTSDGHVNLVSNSSDQSYQELAKFAENWWECTHTDNLNHFDKVYSSQDQRYKKLR